MDFLSYEWYILTIAGVLLLSFLIQSFYYLYFYTGILCHSHRENKGKIPYITIRPSVSVIICARNENEHLKQFLPSVLEQKYPNYEVIVVNDGSSDNTEETLLELQKQYPHLYHTYIPEDAMVMSSKKMALTVGIKAAKHDLLVFTDADCKPVSRDWLNCLIRNFDNKTNFVLGYGAYEQKKGILGHLISYDTFTIALQYLGFAKRGHPYMGVGRNLAYRKELFFKNKGFASILHLQSGDDDLFVNQHATGNNTRIEVNEQSITISEPKQNFSDWFYQKQRHLSTSKYYRFGTDIMIGTEVLSRGLFYLSLLILCIISPLEIKIFGLGIYFLRWLIQALVINLSAKHFGERQFYLSIIFFDILLPLLTQHGMFINKYFRKNKNFRWK